jgi:hypothetical protein
VRSRETAADILSLGLLLIFTGAFEPALLLVTPLMAVGLLLGAATVSRQAVGLRGVAVALGASVLAFVALFPWSLTFIQPGVKFSVLTGAVTDAVHAPQLGQLFRFDVGPYGTGILSWGLFAGATYVLFAGRSVRFQWGVRLWVLGLWSVLIAWLGGQGWLGEGWGASRVFLTPFAVVVALLIGIGVSTVLEDLRQRTLGLRHVATAVFVVVSVAGIFPILGATLNGRFDTPATGYDTMLSWISNVRPLVTRTPDQSLAGQQAIAGGQAILNSSAASSDATVPRTLASTSFRVLWLGNPSALPLTSWQITPGLAYGITSDGLPNATSIWPNSHLGTSADVVRAIESAESGLTVRLGSLLASNNIRYVIIPTFVAPQLIGTQSARPAPAPQLLLDALANQNDLHQLPSEGGALVFANTVAPKSVLAVPSGLPGPLYLIGVLVELAFWIYLARVGLRERRTRQTARRHLRAEQTEQIAHLDVELDENLDDGVLQ